MLFEKPKREVVIGNDPANVDGLNFLEGKSMAYINRKAFEGTVLAHNDGGVPNVVISAPDFSEDTLGQIIYFFEKACAISGYLLGVNPFNQPGVKAIRRTCLLCSASRVTKAKKKHWKQDFPNKKA